MSEPNAYLRELGLREQPFAPTADPAYFYAAREHKQCLFRLWSSIDERHGISIVLGNYGTGKTTLLRKILTGMAADPERYNTAVVGSPIPSWTSFALLESIVFQFGLKPEKRSFMGYMDALYDYLLMHRDRVCTLIIDDAQNLNKRGQVELLRLVQNLETPQHKLLNLVLFAQLEWMPVLRAVPNFEQRVNTVFRLSALSLDETRQFITYRLVHAGGREDYDYFDEHAIRAIHAFSEGVPRVIVTLCRNALLIASQIHSQVVDREIVLHTIEKTTLPDPEKQERVTRALQAADAELAQQRVAKLEEVMAAKPATTDSRDDQASRLLLRAVRAKKG